MLEWPGLIPLDDTCSTPAMNNGVHTAKEIIETACQTKYCLQNANLSPCNLGKDKEIEQVKSESQQASLQIRA